MCGECFVVSWNGGCSSPSFFGFFGVGGGSNIDAVWLNEGIHVDEWVLEVRRLSEARGPRLQGSVCSDKDVHSIYEPAELPREWKLRLYDELRQLPVDVDTNRFVDGASSGIVQRNCHFRFIVLHLNSGTSGTTWILRWIPEIIGKYFGKVTFEIFVCDVQTRFSRTAAAGVRAARWQIPESMPI